MIAGHRRRAVTNFADWWESSITSAVDKTTADFEKQVARLGDHPIGVEKATEREQLANYLAHKDDHKFWQELLTDPKTGRTEIARKLRAFHYAAEMSELEQKYGQELSPEQVI